MKDILIIFGILLVLLTLISAFGGTIRSEPFVAETAPSEFLINKESFESAPVIDAPPTVVSAPPASFAPDLSYASLTTEEESRPRIEGFPANVPAGPTHIVEAFDGQCQYASV